MAPRVTCQIPCVDRNTVRNSVSRVASVEASPRLHVRNDHNTVVTVGVALDSRGGVSSSEGVELAPSHRKHGLSLTERNLLGGCSELYQVYILTTEGESRAE